MRIAILTLPLHVNFGGILQCYALQTILERKGHEVFVLHTGSEEVDYKTRAGLFVKRLIKTILRMESKFYGWKTDDEVTRKHTQSFIKKYIHIGNVTDLSLMREDDFDAIVVGSDQIWRPKYYKPIEDAYLKFAKDWHVKRIAYATSFGTDGWEYSSIQTKNCSRLAKLFHAVSVREITGINMCEKYLGVNAQQVLDPTLLLNKEDYIKLFEEDKTPKREGTLLTYILDETLQKTMLVKNIARQENLIPFRVNSKAENLFAPLSERVQPPVEQWIRGFYDAEFVVTDSFHACAFSILFHKPFVVYPNEQRGLSRFLSLLEILGLESRIMTSGKSYNKLAQINWETVEKKMNKWRKHSVKFLLEKLNDI